MATGPNEIWQKLSGLPRAHRVAFCASCTQRLVPNYEKFYREEKWGSPELLRMALGEVWAFLERQEAGLDRIRDMVSSCEAAAPDTERFESLYTSSALDAVSALTETMQCCQDGGVEHGSRVATAARDTVDMYVQVRDRLGVTGQAMEAVIARDPLMAREIAKQQQDLVDLGLRDTLTPEFLAGLRASSSYDILA